MSTRILIQHISAAKANQVEQFPLESYSELTVGRDPSCNINFDPQRDEYVSRRHARILIGTGTEPSFKLIDLGSRNGTLINGEKISGEVELVPGDTIELGAGGPKFRFDLQPRPQNLISRTRIIPGNLGETKIFSPAEIEAAAKAASTPELVKTSVGRNTVIGMLATQRTQTNRAWMYVLAGVLVVVAVGGGGLYYQSKMKAEAANAALERHQLELEAQKIAATKAQIESSASLKKAQEESAAAIKKAQEDSAASLHRAVGITPPEIVRKYGMCNGGSTTLVPASRSIRRCSLNPTEPESLGISNLRITRLSGG
jgi:pSer/pThr/pTyr-binding forkhead associated (FHA) protein